MPTREYEIEAEETLPEGFAPGQPIEASADDPGALAELMLKTAVVLEMVGGTFSVVALRRELAGPNGESTGLWVPDRYIAKWDSFAPGGSIRRQRERQQAAPAAEASVVEEAPAPPADPEADLTPEEMEDHFPEADQAELEPDEGASPDPDVDPARPASSGFDMGDLLGSAPAEDVLAGVE